MEMQSIKRRTRLIFHWFHWVKVISLPRILLLQYKSPPHAALQGVEPANERRQADCRGYRARWARWCSVFQALAMHFPLTDVLYGPSWTSELLSSLQIGSCNYLLPVQGLEIANVPGIYLVSICPPKYLCVIEGLEVSLKEMLKVSKYSRGI